MMEGAGGMWMMGGMTVLWILVVIAHVLGIAVLVNICGADLQSLKPNSTV